MLNNSTTIQYESKNNQHWDNW